MGQYEKIPAEGYPINSLTSTSQNCQQVEMSIRGHDHYPEGNPGREKGCYIKPKKI